MRADAAVRSQLVDSLGRFKRLVATRNLAVLDELSPDTLSLSFEPTTHKPQGSEKSNFA
jgi:hypothetical protein